MNDSKDQRLVLEEKFNKYKKESQNERMFLFKINQIFSDEFDEIIDDILILNENQFFEQLKERVENELSEIYSDKIIYERKYNNFIEKGLNNIKPDYKSNYDLLYNTYEKFSEKKNTKKK